VRLNKIIILLLVLSHSVDIHAAEETYKICKPFAEIAPQPPKVTPSNEDSVQVSADSATLEEEQGLSTFEGYVVVQRADQILTTDTAVYNRKTDVLTAKNGFTLWDKRFTIRGSKVELRPKQQGEMTNAHYWLLNRRARGYAKKVKKQSKDIAQFEQTTYTTCAPGNEVWRLQAGKITLDDAKAKGTARNVTIHILGIPIFYTPYLSFPLSDARQSGFLMPQFGVSDEAGTDFSIPYYLNLAPNYDATLTPRIMSRRGLLLKTDFRYLTQSAGGNLKLEYLPNDRARKESRASASFQHNGAISARWATNIDFNYASDERYFEELGNSLRIASITHLERRGDLYYYGNGWMGLGRLQSFQTLDTSLSSRPYQRLPQLLFKTDLPQQNRKLNTALQAEFVRFDRDTKQVAGPIGNRIDLKSSFSFPLRSFGTFVIPKLSLLYTDYKLSNVGVNKNTRQKRALFRFSTDSGLFLERQVNWWGTDFIQTLEPRVYYRYTPYKDQSDIPIFDTARYDLSFLQLFRENSFSGADRIDDGHQMAFGVTSRLLGSNSGIEHLRLSFGGIYYFQDRRVILPGEEIGTTNTSNLIGELAAQIAKNWQASGTLRWNPHTQNTEHTVMRIRYHSDSQNIFNVSYRLRDNSLEQIDTSLHWTLGKRWKILGRWNISLPDDKTLETFTGLEYSSCCWAVRGVARRYLNSADGSEYLNGFFLQFHLKGLGGLGKKADAFLEESIPGFHDHF
jgi:LPS-assembly protein